MHKSFLYAELHKIRRSLCSFKLARIAAEKIKARIKSEKRLDRKTFRFLICKTE